MKAMGLVGLAGLALLLNDCTEPRCGDDVKDGGEECYDGGDALSCDADCTEPVCGDGRVNTVAGEECDDGYADACGTCNAECSAEGTGPGSCGDGVACAEADEECDDGAANSEAPNAACRTNCLPQRCGDDVKDDGEECDDGYNDACGACNDTCTAPGTGLGSCGDGVSCEEAGEECDDGNIANGDGCESTCMWPEWQSFTTSNTGGGLAGDVVQAISLDSAGGKWFGTRRGVSHLSADNTTWTTFTTENTDGGLVDDYVLAIALDSAGGKWLGTSGGVIHLSADNTTWTTFTKANTDGGLVDDYVLAIALDSAGGKWVSTGSEFGGGGVSHLSADNTTWTTFTTANTGGGLVDDYVLAIALDSAGGKWLGTSGGVIHLSADNTTWTTFTKANTDGGLAGNGVLAIALDSAGGKWLGTWGGVSHLSADNTTWTTFTPANTGGGLPYSWVHAVALDSAGGKWLGAYAPYSSNSSDGGVSHLSADNTTWTTLTTPNTGGGPAGYEVIAIAIDSAGGKWFGTYGGVSYWAATFGM